MTGLLIIYGMMALGALAWMLFLLARRPHDVRLRAITVLVGCWAAAYPFGAAADDGTGFLATDPMVSRAIQHLLILVGGYSLICFFLYSTNADPRTARARAWWHLLPLVAAAAVLSTAVAGMPAGIRTAAAVLPAAKGAGPVGEPSIGLFYVTANSYLLYTSATAWVLTRQYARGAEPRLRRGLLITLVGLTCIVTANAVFVTANITRWAGTPMPRPILIAASIVMLPGILGFLVGVSYPAAVMRLTALRIWLRHRRMYRRLGPLWQALHAQFPQDALRTAPTRPWLDAIGLWEVHRRYYRRVIECRDGLVRISPQLARLREAGRADDPLADLLRDALRAHAAGEPAPPHAVAVAVPAGASLDADARELAALSDVLRTR